MTTVIAKLNRLFTRTNLMLITVFAIAYAFTVTGGKDLKTVSVSADKMNVLYIGVNNPLTVAVEGIPDEKVGLASDEVEISKTARGKYNVIARNPGVVNILVYGEGFDPQEMTFRVKRLPDPVATLENPDLYFKTEGTVTAEAFKKTAGIMLNMGGCFDFDNTLKVAQFSIVKVPKNGDPVEVMCNDGTLTDPARKLIESAAAGDTYYFETVKVMMEGDPGERKLNSLVFRIK